MMKKIIVLMILGCVVVLLSACIPKEELVSFTGILENYTEKEMLVMTTDDVGFTKANVGYNEVKLDFIPEIDQELVIEILSEIKESDPVQVTAVSIHEKKSEYQKITAIKEKEIIDNQKDSIIVDVRTQSEYESGYIENAQLIPSAEIKNLAPELIPDKEATILVYCKSGNRSQQASEALIERGYKNVFDLGGISDWPYEIVTK
jgi:rhodanese-related sulfurtransferase